MMETIFINHSERLSVPRMSQETYRKIRNSGRESRMRDNVRESATTLTSHNCKRVVQQLGGRGDVTDLSLSWEGTAQK